MTTHEDCFNAVHDNPSRWVMQAACQMVGAENVLAAIAERLQEPCEGFDVEVWFAAATTGGILTSVASWKGGTPQCKWMFTPWHRVDGVEVTSAGINNDEVRPVSAKVYEVGGDRPLELPLSVSRGHLNDHELQVLQVVMRLG